MTMKKSELQLHFNDEPGQSLEELHAQLVVDGTAAQAHIAQMMTSKSMGQVGISECVEALRGTIKKVQGGDLSSLESMLMGQVVALNTIFHECSRRSALNMGEHLDATDTYLRLALRAQNQVRTTIQTLTEIKRPRSVAFVDQANIACGHQQVINEASHAHVREIEKQPNELLEGKGHVKRMDKRKARAAG